MNRGTNSDATAHSVEWRYFVSPNKAATPQFDELCRGLASIIVSVYSSRICPFMQHETYLLPCSVLLSLLAMLTYRLLVWPISIGPVEAITMSCS